jgi:preprotein translocase subunit YajC
MRISIILLFALFTFSLNAQQSEQPKGQKSRLDNIEKLYKLSKADKITLDSILHPVISTLDIIQSTTKKITIKDSLILSSITIPIEAQILTDSLGAYNEVVTYRTITAIVSEVHEKGSVKAYQDRIKAEKAKIAARLREQAAQIEKE